MAQVYQLDGHHLKKATGLIDNRAFYYGDGFFSTLGVYHDNILWLSAHQKRLADGAKQFCLNLDIPTLTNTLINLAKTLKQGIIKVIITRKPQKVRGYGFDFDNTSPAQVFVTSTQLDLYNHLPFIQDFAINTAKQAICLSECLGIRPPRFAGLKLISSHEHVFAHHELLNHQKHNSQIAEGLVKNIQNLWISGTISNVFYQLNSNWYTPSVSQSGVAGVARQILLSSTTASERPLTDDDLTQLSGLFFCNAVRGIMPISTLHITNQSHHLNPDAFYSLLTPNA